jgi:hypothetical protein
MKTNSDLLIRIDERQKEMSKDILSIKQNIDCKVDNDNVYEARGKKIDTLWDDRNKVIGYLMGAGVIGGVTSNILGGLVKTIFAQF